MEVLNTQDRPKKPHILVDFKVRVALALADIGDVSGDQLWKLANPMFSVLYPQRSA